MRPFGPNRCSEVSKTAPTRIVREKMSVEIVGMKNGEMPNRLRLKCADAQKELEEQAAR